jgi:biopolymer transport protein ExbD
MDHFKQPKQSSSELADESERGLDMTPMVDVTFLLLIFFMVTASFVMQKSIEQPPAATGLNHPVESDVQQIQVAIDQDDIYYVSAPGLPETEAPSITEMRALVKDAAENLGLPGMTILAHVNSSHASLVAAWDAGVVCGVDEMEIHTTLNEF